MRAHFIPVVSVVIAATFVGVLDHRLAERDAPPVIEEVDLQQLLTEQVAEVSKQKLNVDQQRDAATTFAAALSDALEMVRRADHAVLLVKPAVITGAVDVTDRIRTQIRLGIDVRTLPPTITPATKP